MPDHLNPDKIYPDDISRRIDTPPGFDSVRTPTGFQRDGGDKTERRCRSRPAEGCEHCAWIDTSRQHEDEDGPINYCRVCGRKLAQSG